MAIVNVDSNAVNEHGLRRSDLSAEIKRSVRQRCGFGCVVCGSVIVQYHHFDPPFAAATEHRAEGITLLCGGCHDKVTRRVWSDEKVRAANADPKAKRSSARELLDLAAPTHMVFGTMIHVGVGPLIQIGPECLLEIQFGEEGAMLNARFFDEAGQPTVTVVENELRFCDDAWDIEAIGPSLVVRRGPRLIVFEATLHPPHGIYVRALNYAMHGWQLKTDSKGRIQMSHTTGRRFDFDADTATVHGGPIDLQPSGQLQLRGGTAIVPYPAKRFKRWVSVGDIDRLLWELTQQPTLHVTRVRNPDAWGVTCGDGTEIARFERRSDALARGHILLKENPTYRLVVHGEGNTPPSFFFAS